jgi:hypothetical protein
MLKYVERRREVPPSVTGWFKKRGTRKMNLGSRLAVAVIAVGSLFVSGISLAAPADATAPIRAGQMVLTGFDVSVAEKNGFAIVTAPDGTQTSVPVTEAARVWVARYADGPARSLAVQPHAGGNCGFDHLSITARNAAGGISIDTGYVLTGGVASYRQNWAVAGVTLHVGFDENFSGWNASTAWTATHHVPVSGGAHGTGHIVPGSVALLFNGGQCGAIPVTDAW